MPVAASFSDGVHEVYKQVNEPIANFKSNTLVIIEEKIKGLNQELQKGQLDSFSRPLLYTQRALYQLSRIAADSLLPYNTDNITVSFVGGIFGAKLLEHGTKELLFAYKAYKKVQQISEKPASNRIQHEALKTKYRQNMEKPPIENKKLQKVVSEQYKPGSKLGSKSTANAIRYEIETAKRVEGKYHLKKGADTIEFLERWLEKNPTASPNDRAAAENILLDLKDAIGEKAWYSQTKPPKY